MPEAGEYLLTGVGFNLDGQPYIALQTEEQFLDLLPLGKTITLKIDTAQRFCIGWRDIETGKIHACPNKNIVDDKYEECPACQKRTGFNPAFYHTTSVSAQQDARNLKPHILYLAHFGPGTIKVGISYAARGNSRLLEQGARSALILGTFPSAHIARQYEAQIAASPGIVETIQLRKKIALLDTPFDSATASAELIRKAAEIEQAIGITFDKGDVMTLDPFFFPSGTPALAESYDCSAQDRISGKAMGVLGSLLFCAQQDTPLFLPIKKYVGYRVRLSYEETAIELPARQTSLF